WSEVGEEGTETFRISHFAFRNFLSCVTPYASRCTAVVGAVALIVCALNQEPIPYPYNLREPDSVTDAKELIRSHPTNAPYHLSRGSRKRNKVPSKKASNKLWREIIVKR